MKIIEVIRTHGGWDQGLGDGRPWGSPRSQRIAEEAESSSLR